LKIATSGSIGSLIVQGHDLVSNAKYEVKKDTAFFEIVSLKVAMAVSQTGKVIA
jgi:hypothetical protein